MHLQEEEGEKGHLVCIAAYSSQSKALDLVAECGRE